MGVKGSLPISEKWEIGYSAEYNFPFHSNLTNDGLPDWKVSNVKGYSWRTHVDLLYAFKEDISIRLYLCAGHQHWEGSEWQTYNNQVKWPGNETYFFHSFWEIIWSFYRGFRNF